MPTNNPVQITRINNYISKIETKNIKMDHIRKMIQDLQNEIEKAGSEYYDNSFYERYIRELDQIEQQLKNDWDVFFKIEGMTSSLQNYEENRKETNFHDLTKQVMNLLDIIKEFPALLFIFQSQYRIEKSSCGFIFQLFNWIIISFYIISIYHNIV